MKPSAHSELERQIGRSAPLIMGVLNATPDSFSDGGKFLDSDQALTHALELVSSGAHILDIGGESTAPGAKTISAEQEIARISPLLQRLSSETFLSVDTYKSQTARFALENGAQMINDVSALRADREMVSVVREFDAYLILMHSKEEAHHPHASESPRDYTDVTAEIGDFLLARIEFALKAGVRLERIICDPGLGKFVSHDPKYSWEILERLSELRARVAPVPIAIGTSRKGFLGGKLVDRDPSSQLTGLLAALKGAAIVRTHHVAMLREFFQIWQRLEAR